MFSFISFGHTSTIVFAAATALLVQIVKGVFLPRHVCYDVSIPLGYVSV